MIRSTTLKANKNTLEVVKKMAALKDHYREKILKKVKDSRK